MPQAQKFPCLFPMLSLIKEPFIVKSENTYMDSFEELKEIGKSPVHITLSTKRFRNLG